MNQAIIRMVVFIFMLLEEFACQGRLSVEGAGREREQLLCPRHLAGRGCLHQHLAQGVGELPNQSQNEINYLLR